MKAFSHQYYHMISFRLCLDITKILNCKWKQSIHYSLKFIYSVAANSSFTTVLRFELYQWKQSILYRIKSIYSFSAISPFTIGWSLSIHSVKAVHSLDIYDYLFCCWKQSINYRYKLIYSVSGSSPLYTGLSSSTLSVEAVYSLLF